MATLNKDYDNVGFYAQDSINGLTEDLLERMMDLVDPRGATEVLDAMGGDGNLSLRLYDYCQRKNIEMPHCTLFEISRVQTEFAKSKLPEKHCDVIWGDMLNFTSLKDGSALEENKYDRIMIKSSNHEISLKDQETLYRNIFRLLKPGGHFVNLGFLFDNEEERNEVRMLASVKDKLAGMKYAEEHRHFMMRDELYERLEKVGFGSVRTGASFDYRIQSNIVSENYFSEESRMALDTENQMAQARCRVLRRNGRIEFVKDRTVLIFPGEVTIARKPHHEVKEKPKGYDSQGHKDQEFHRNLVKKVVDYIPPETVVTDFACGYGFLAENLVGRGHTYRGFDVSKQCIEHCESHFKYNPDFLFRQVDINNMSAPRGSEVVTLINVLNLPTVKPISLLKRIYESLVPGGIVIVACPSAGNEVDKLKTSQKGRSNYWSEAGMVELFNTLGFTSIQAVERLSSQDDNYIIVAKK